MLKMADKVRRQQPLLRKTKKKRSRGGRVRRIASQQAQVSLEQEPLKWRPSRDCKMDQARSSG